MYIYKHKYIIQYVVLSAMKKIKQGKNDEEYLEGSYFIIKWSEKVTLKS